LKTVKNDWTSSAKDALLGVAAGGTLRPATRLGLASRFAGLWVVRASIPTPQPMSQDMSTLSIATRSIEKPQTPKKATFKKESPKSNPTPKAKITAAAANPKATPKATTAADLKVARVTKQERVLTLLSRADGASIEEIMQSTDWQQHSVRGFLAGTVKRKLGFPLTSSKGKDGVRRYRIEKRRARSDG
jgi:hypothetical protein